MSAATLDTTTSEWAVDTPVLLAVSYLCVSTREQAERGSTDEAFSIPAQREANARKADELGARNPARSTRPPSERSTALRQLRGADATGLRDEPERSHLRPLLADPFATILHETAGGKEAKREHSTSSDVVCSHKTLWVGPEGLEPPTSTV